MRGEQGGKTTGQAQSDALAGRTWLSWCDGWILVVEVARRVVDEGLVGVWWGVGATVYSLSMTMSAEAKKGVLSVRRPSHCESECRDRVWDLVRHVKGHVTYMSILLCGSR